METIIPKIRPHWARLYIPTPAAKPIRGEIIVRPLTRKPTMPMMGMATCASEAGALSPTISDTPMAPSRIKKSDGKAQQSQDDMANRTNSKMVIHEILHELIK